MASSSPLSLSLTGLPLRSSAAVFGAGVHGDFAVDQAAEVFGGGVAAVGPYGGRGVNHVAFAVGDHQGDGLAVGDVAGGTADLHGGVVAEVTQGDVERTGGGVEFAAVAVADRVAVAVFGGEPAAGSPP
ncbi:hypothetical protein CEK60_21810 [Halomonas sp. N3-2A]|nr:hypothetical protein CEK60_21810 [Halomonas sp. N3-2A]